MGRDVKKGAGIRGSREHGTRQKLAPLTKSEISKGIPVEHAALQHPSIKFVVGHGLAEEDIIHAKQLFLEKDLDGSGFLKADELVAVLRKLRHEVPLQRMKMLMEPYDLNGDGRLDLREFVNMLSLNSATIVNNKGSDELHTDALIERLGEPDYEALTALGGTHEEVERPSTSSGDRLPQHKLDDIDARLADHFGLEGISISQLLPAPITEEKLRQFLLGTTEPGSKEIPGVALSAYSLR